MSSIDLTQLLTSSSSGAQITLPPGEFKGPFKIDRPISIIGSGLATVLWSPQGPVVSVHAPNTSFERLSIEVTEDYTRPAIKLDSNYPVQFNQVRILGKVDGLSSGQKWDLPEMIDFGVLVPGKRVSKLVVVRVPSPAVLSSSCAGLQVITKSLISGSNAVKLEFEEDHLVPGMLIDGLLEISCGGIVTLLRITGEVQSIANTVARQRNRAEVIGGDLLSGAGTPRPVAEPINEASEPLEEEDGNTWKPQPVSDKPIYTIDSFIERAQKAEETKETDQARQIFEEALMTFPQNIRLRESAANFFERIGDFSGAGLEWEIIHSIDPTNQQVIRHLAKAYNQTHRHKETILLMEKALEQGEHTAEVYRFLAMAYSQDSRYEEAIWAMERAQDLEFVPKLKGLLIAWKRQLSS